MFFKNMFGTFLVTNSNKMSKKVPKKHLYIFTLPYIVINLFF